MTDYPPASDALAALEAEWGIPTDAHLHEGVAWLEWAAERIGCADGCQKGNECWNYINAQQLKQIASKLRQEAKR